MTSCVICLEDRSENPNRPTLACGHGKNVHRPCLERWLKQNPKDQKGILTGTCPVCRAPLVEITDEYDHDFETRPSMLIVTLNTVIRMGKGLFGGRPRERSSSLRGRGEGPT